MLAGGLVGLAQLRFARRAAASLLSALFGIAIAVASIVGVHLLSAEIDRVVDRQARPLGTIEVFLQRDGLSDAHYFELRRRLRAGEWPRVAGLAPILEGRVRVDGEWLRVIGTDLLALQTGALPATQASGWPAFDWERLLTEDAIFLPPDLLVDTDEARIGDTVVAVLGRGARPGLALADLPTTRRVLDAQDHALSSIGVLFHPAPSTAVDRLRELLAALFPGVVPATDPEPLAGLSDWRQPSVAANTPGRKLTRAVLFNVAALGLLSLVVAWLLMAQIARHALERRASMLDRLVALGVSQRRLLRRCIGEGAVTGVLASLAGLLLGWWLAAALLSAIQGGGDVMLPLDGWAVGKALFSGCGVALLGYALAARAVLFPPAALLLGAWRWVLAAVLLGAAVVGLALPATGLFGAFLAILAGVLALLLVLPLVLVGLARASLSWPLRLMVLLPLRQICQAPELRLGVSALALALAAALGIGSMVASFRVAYDTLLDARLQDDVALEWADWRRLGEHALPAHVRQVRLGSQPVRAAGRDALLEFAAVDAELLERFAPAARLAPGEVLISEQFGRSLNLRPGGRLEIEALGATHVLTIASWFADYGTLESRVLVGLADARRIMGDELRFTRVLLDAGDTADGSAGADLRALLAARQLPFEDQRQVRDRAEEIFDQTFAITRALTALALLVAALSLMNALVALALQSSPTGRLLRVLGASRRGRFAVLATRAGSAAAVATLLALPLGIFIAAVLCYVVNPRAFGWSFPLELTPGALGWPLLAALLAALASTLVSAWRRD